MAGQVPYKMKPNFPSPKGKFRGWIVYISTDDGGIDEIFYILAGGFEKTLFF